MSTVLEVMLESANDLGTSDDDDDEFADGEEQVILYLSDTCSCDTYITNFA